MIKHGYGTILGFSLACSFPTTVAFAVTIDGKPDPNVISAPMVAEVMLAVALALGIMISPILYWTFRGRSLVLWGPLLCVFSIAASIITNFLQIRGSLFIVSSVVLAAIFILNLNFRRMDKRRTSQVNR